MTPTTSRRVAVRRATASAALLGLAALAAAGTAAAVSTGSVSPTDGTIAPSAATTVTATFDSEDGNDVLISVIAAPSAGATGTMVVSAPSTQTTPTSGAGNFNCAVNVVDDSVLDCLWVANGEKTTGQTAQVTFTVTASADADGTFDVTSYNDNTSPTVPGGGVQIATAAIDVAQPATTTVAPTTTAAPTSTAAASTTTVAVTTTQATTTTTAGGLPVTGGNEGRMLVAALAAMTAGAGALALSRRQG